MYNRITASVVNSRQQTTWLKKCKSIQAKNINEEHKSSYRLTQL